MQRAAVLLLWVLAWNGLQAQFIDHFTDGELGSDPVWMGDTSDFVVNAGGELQLDATAAGSSFIHTASFLADSTEWLFRVRLAFSPSASNLARVWLMADSSTAGGPVNGYFLQFGETGSSDAISLILDTAGGRRELCRGPAGQVASPFDLEVRVTRSRTGLWALFSREIGQTAWTILANASDTSLKHTSLFAIQCIYTQSNVKNFIFDDILVREIYRDFSPPGLDTAWFAGRDKIVLLADEPLLPEALETENYVLFPGEREPDIVEWNDLQHKGVILSFAGGTGNGDFGLGIGRWCDPDTNCSGNLEATLSLHLPEAWDIVINEIMADPDPAPAGLPAVEYIELHNRSPFHHCISGWKLLINGSVSHLPSLELPSGGFAVLTSKPQGFPITQGLYALQGMSLPNTGAELRLLDDAGVVISGLSYTANWYDDPFREEGGWSLEQIDADRPWDAAGNWTVSHSVSGGSPGTANSRAEDLPDRNAPKPGRAYPVGEGRIRVFFSEPLSPQALDPTLFHLSLSGKQVTGVRDADGMRASLIIEIPGFPEDGKACRMSWQAGIADLSGNPLDTGSIWFGWPQPCGRNDIIINEILTDPWPGGEDFVEVYNRSDYVVDLQGLRLCARDPETGEVQKVSRIVQDTFLICPGEYRILSPSEEAIREHYPASATNAFTADMPDFPSFPDAEGEVLLADHTGLEIDAVAYSADMHSGFLADPEGVSLERLDTETPSSLRDNWHSAAYTSGYATPGYRNSQQAASTGREEVEAKPEAISPDGDGADDILTVSLRPSRPGTLANLRIFSEDGRQQRTLALGQTLSDQNVYYWDGSDDDGNLLPYGRYILLVQFFYEDGKGRKEKRLLRIVP
jgi:hypothetical protein